MRITKIHIENFGKLSKVDLDLDKELNLICEANGFGKTTLSVFIIAMFFGFDGEKKRAIIESQRKRYAPWQGGVYGGSITFEHEGKTYLLERTFGSKDAKSDIFELYDVKTMLPSNDFGENIGEELLAIDRESFVRTAFIGQHDIETKATSAIGAKIGNLSDEDSDLSEYEDVIKNLKDKTNSLTGSRKTGELAKVRNRLAELSVEIAKEKSKEIALSELSNQKADVLSEIEDKLDEQAKVTSKINEISSKQKEYNELSSAKNMLDKAAEDVKEAEDKYEEIMSFFKAGVPDEVALAEAMESNHLLATGVEMIEKEACSATEFKELEKHFGYSDALKVSDDIDLAVTLSKEALDKYSKAETLEIKLASLSAEAASLGAERAKLSSDIQSREDIIARYKESLNYSSATINLPVIIGGFVIFLGLVMLVLKLSIGTSIGAICLGLCLVVLGLVTKKNKKPNLGDSETLAKLEQMLKESEQELTDNQDRTAAIGNEAEECKVKLNALKGEINQVQSEISQIFARMQIAEYSLEPEFFFKLKNDFVKLTRIKVATAGYNTCFEKISKFLRDYGFEAPHEERDYSGILTEIKVQIELLQSAEERLKDKSAILAELNSEDMTVKLERAAILEAELEATKIETLNDERTMLQTQIDERREKAKQLDDQISSIQDELDEIDASRIEYEELSVESVSLAHRLDILKKTSELLEEAKNNLTTKYIGPFRNSFHKYYEMVEAESDKEYIVDAKLNVSVKEQGLNRDIGFLSSGYQDLVNLCSRLAMLDCMYEEEKPVVIMDDPFVNLDDDKFAKAMDLLRDVSSEYQIIYFSCRA